MSSAGNKKRQQTTPYRKKQQTVTWARSPGRLQDVSSSYTAASVPDLLSTASVSETIAPFDDEEDDNENQHSYFPSQMVKDALPLSWPNANSPKLLDVNVFNEIASSNAVRTQESFSERSSWDDKELEWALKLEAEWRIMKNDRVVVCDLSNDSLSCKGEHYVQFKITKVVAELQIDSATGNYFRTICGIARQVSSRRPIDQQYEQVIELHNRWSETRISSGDVINIIWTVPSNLYVHPQKIVVDDDVNYLILNPDVLMTPTRIADANSCLRKVAFMETTTSYSGSGNRYTVLGHLKHELFERALMANNFTEEYLLQIIHVIVKESRSVESLFQLEMTEAEAQEELEKCVKAFSVWGNKFLGNGPGEFVTMHHHQSQDCQKVKVKSVLATEEQIWSPMWGLKGVLDATVLLELPNTSGSVLLVPLELKTGRMGPIRVEHQAQVVLYCLMLADRYGHSAIVSEMGLLVQAPTMDEDLHQPLKTIGILPRHGEIRDLVLIRNSLVTRPKSIEQYSPPFQQPQPQQVQQEENSAHQSLISLVQEHLGDDNPSDWVVLANKQRFPPVTRNLRGECSRCPQRPVCTLVHVAMEQGNQTSINLAVQEYEQTISVLSTTHLRYYKKLQDQLFFEEHVALLPKKKKNIDEYLHLNSLKWFWRKTVEEKETKSRNCLGHLSLRASDKEFVYEFTRDRDILVHELKFEVGDLVLISIDQSQLGLAQGEVMEISSRKLVVFCNRFPRHLHAERRLVVGAWRVDKLDIAYKNRYLATNVNWLFAEEEGNAKANAQKKRIRELIVDGKEPRFVDDENRGVRKASSEALKQALEIANSLEGVRAVLANHDPLVTISHNKVPPPVHLTLAAQFSQLTRDQVEAVLYVLATEDYLCIKGAPGSGKTTTLAFIVALLHALGKSVLITAFTHTACDNLLLKIVTSHNVNVLRIATKSSSVKKEVRPYLLPDNCRVADLNTYLNDPALICGSTCLSLRHGLLKRKHFDYCIIDEAGQLDEASSLGCLATSTRFIFVGDPKQLPPLIRSRHARELGMDISLFERLCNHSPTASLKLTTQFRMNQDLNALANELFYGNTLQCGNGQVAEQKLHLPHLIKQNLNTQQWLFQCVQPLQAVVFVNTDGLVNNQGREHYQVPSSGGEDNNSNEKTTQADTREELVVTNLVEARLVSVTVDRLLRCGVRGCDIGVISPYRAQLKILRQVVVPAIEVDTVDKFQGRDKACIIVSLVRSNPERNIGELLGDSRRLNVSFTRAKCKLIVIGSANTLAQSEAMAMFLKFVRLRNWEVELRGEDHRLYQSPLADKI